jgi:outer membrane receptor protein involved in Fe transport
MCRVRRDVFHFQDRNSVTNRYILICCALLLCSAAALAQQPNILRGTVLDPNSAPISNAEIELRSASKTKTAFSDDHGAFTFSDVTPPQTITVRHASFAPVMLEITASSFANPIEIRMTPAPIVQRIEVSAATDDTVPPDPTSQYIISQQAIKDSGALEIDDILRQAPGFSLFRRSGSLFANPTTQGVSLRGVGASGSSRANVLLDGIPLNDPFGGWVYWNQIPRESIDKVEITNGGASDMYGGGALGGVINIETRPVQNSFATAEMSYGNENTPYLSLDAGTVINNWGVSASVQSLRTTGYILVPAAQRGTIDTDAGTADFDGSLQLSRKFGEENNFFVRFNSLEESRDNGTPVQTNNTRLPSLALGLDWTQSNLGSFSIRAFASDEVFTQNFSSIAANRDSETLTDAQRSPSQQLGFAAQWHRTFKSKHTITAGVETRDVEGRSVDNTFNAAGPTANVDAGGREITIGYFAQDTYLFAPNWLLTFGGRVDTLFNNDGFTNRVPLPTGLITSQVFPNRTESAFSPRVSLMHSFKYGITASASVYRAFRAPTLNELYRNFRVGSIVTDANAALTAEILTGGEAGLSLQRWNNRLTIRGNFFWSEIQNPVESVTLSTTPTLITDERQNLGAIRAIGAEFSAELRLPKHLQLTGGYILTDSTVISFAANTALVGLQVPQVPKNQFNVQLSYSGNVWTAGVQTRYTGNQFDDDQNLLALGRAFIVDAEVSRRLGAHASIFCAAGNILDDRFTTARTPITDVGPPTLIRGGIRLTWPAR